VESGGEGEVREREGEGEGKGECGRGEGGKEVSKPWQHCRLTPGGKHPRPADVPDVLSYHTAYGITLSMLS